MMPNENAQYMDWIQNAQYMDWIERLAKNDPEDIKKMNTELLLFIAMNIRNIDENISLIRTCLPRNYYHESPYQSPKC